MSFLDLKNQLYLETHDEELYDACQSGDEIATAKLLERGASPFASGGKPILLATQAGHKTVLSLLLSHTGKSSHPCKNKALVYVSCTGRLDLAHLLISHGADPNAKFGLALYVAVDRGDVAMYSLLISYGAFVPGICARIEFLEHVRTRYYLSPFLPPYECDAPCDVLVEEAEKKKIVNFTHFLKEDGKEDKVNFAHLVGKSQSMDILQLVLRDYPSFATIGAADAMEGAVFARDENMIRALWNFPHTYDAFLSASLKRAIIDGKAVEDDDGFAGRVVGLSVHTLVHYLGARVEANGHEALCLATFCEHVHVLDVLSEYYAGTDWDCVVHDHVLFTAIRYERRDSLAWVLDKFCFQNQNNIVQVSKFGLQKPLVEVLLPRLEGLVKKTPALLVNIFHLLLSKLSKYENPSASSLGNVLQFYSKHKSNPTIPEKLKPLLGHCLEACCRPEMIHDLETFLSWLSDYDPIDLNYAETFRKACLNQSVWGLPHNKAWEEKISMIARCFHQHGFLDGLTICNIAIETENAALSNEYFSFVSVEEFSCSFEVAVSNNLLAIAESYLSDPVWLSSMKKTEDFMNALSTCIKKGFRQLTERLVEVLDLSSLQLSEFLVKAISARQEEIVSLLSRHGARLFIHRWTCHSYRYLGRLLKSGELCAPVSLLDETVQSFYQVGLEDEDEDVDEDENNMEDKANGGDNDTLFEMLLRGDIVLCGRDETSYKEDILSICMKRAVFSQRFDKALEYYSLGGKSESLKQQLLLFLTEEAAIHGRKSAFNQLLAITTTDDKDSIRFQSAFRKAVKTGNMEIVCQFVTRFPTLSSFPMSQPFQKTGSILQKCLEHSVSMFRLVFCFLNNCPNTEEYWQTEHLFRLFPLSQVTDMNCANQYLSLCGSSHGNKQSLFHELVPFARKSVVFSQILFSFSNDLVQLPVAREVHTGRVLPTNFPRYMLLEFLTSKNRDALYALLEANLLCPHRFVDLYISLLEPEARKGNFYRDWQECVVLLMDALSRDAQNNIVSCGCLVSNLDACVASLNQYVANLRYGACLSDTLVKSMMTWKSSCLHEADYYPELQEESYQTIFLRRARFALQEYGFIHWVLTVLEVFSHDNPDADAAGDEKRKHIFFLPLPVFVLRNITIRESFTTLVDCRLDAAKFKAEITD